MISSEVHLNKLLAALPETREQHSSTSASYGLFKEVARDAVHACFASENEAAHQFGPFGQLIFPYRKMGAIDSLDLFGLDELMIFSFYWQNRERYKTTLDVGANIGLHSIAMSRCGFNVRAFEPDPKTAEALKANLKRNNCENCEVVIAAVSDKHGKAEFVRVLGNTTGSHLAGAKKDPYGDLERFDVTVVPINEMLQGVDFMKLDAEGHEAVILLSTNELVWDKTDAIVEVGSPDNAKAVFEHFQKLGVNLFAQKQGWNRITSLAQMPTSYKEGSLFISSKDRMPW